MSVLAPDLFDRRFDDLLEIGRSQLPGLAPDWTDYNLHDPGITLLELLAWVAEAQMYSLSRMRRDERAAYAVLAGLAPRGPRAASGVLWPAPRAAGYPSQASAQSMVIPAGALVRPEHVPTPAYRTVRKQLWLGADLTGVRSRDARGRATDHTSTNERGSVAFLPFGALAGPRDVLELTLLCRSETGLLPPRRNDAEGACISIGVRADSQARPASGVDPDRQPSCQALEVVMRTGGQRYPLQVIEDSSHGFMRSGALSLALPALPDAKGELVIEIRAPRGFPRPPRVLAIAFNAIAVRQGRLIESEVHLASTLPDQCLPLQERDLEFGDEARGLRVESIETGARHIWRQVSDLSTSGPSDRDYTLDTVRGMIRFGNGINGRIAQPGAQILLSYAVCDGAAGNSPRNQRWIVQGFSGVYGTNPDAFVAGSDGSDLAGQRREARRRAREDHALVTASDLEAAALALPDLEVAQALALAPIQGAPATGEMQLIALRLRHPALEPSAAPGQGPETARWLAEVKRQLAPRLPMGLRLMVRGPRYVGFHIRAELQATERADPAAVAAAVRHLLIEREVKPVFGQALAARDIAALIRTVADVARVRSLQLHDAGGNPVQRLRIPPDAIAVIDLAASQILVHGDGSAA